MFSATALRGFINTLQVNVADRNAKEASALLARVAVGERDRVLAEQHARSGLAPRYCQIVDGKEGAPLTAVKPDGVIVFAWQYLAEIVRDTHEALIRRSPVSPQNSTGSVQRTTTATCRLKLPRCSTRSVR